MKQRTRLTTEQQQQLEQASALGHSQQAGLEFQSAEELLRHDAAQTMVPPAIVTRLGESTRGLEPPRRPWWRRMFE